MYWGLSLGGSCRDLIDRSRTGKRDAVDGGDQRRLGAIDGHKHYTSRHSAVGTRIQGDLRDITRGCLHRSIAEVGGRPVETAEGPEACHRVVKSAVGRPEAG